MVSDARKWAVFNARLTQAANHSPAMAKLVVDAHQFRRLAAQLSFDPEISRTMTEGARRLDRQRRRHMRGLPTVVVAPWGTTR